MKKFSYSVLCSMCLSASLASKPVANNINVEQDSSGCVVVSYDLVASGGSSEPGIVTVDFLCAGKTIGAENYALVWGDVNRKVEPGVGKKIWWLASRDWSGHSYASNGTLTALVTVWATNAPPTYMEINLLDPKAIAYYSCEAAVPMGVTNEIYKTDRMLMRRIPAKGIVFRMGSPSVEENRNPDYEAPFFASFSSDYYIGIYPVTQKQYYNLQFLAGYAGANYSYRVPSYFSSDRGFDNAHLRPVERVSYQKLRGEDNNAATDGDADCLWPQCGHAVLEGSFIGVWREKLGIELDLPTEAQWEYACRVGTSGPINVEGATLDDVAWHPGNSAVEGVRQTHPVGLKLPNAWGLYDMLGNVSELCLDCVTIDSYPVAETVEEAKIDYGGNEANVSGNVRAHRGGCFGFVNDKGQEIGFDCRSAARKSQFSVACDDPNQGLRLCCPAGDAVSK